MKIRFYGSLSEAIGREVELEAQPGATVGDLRRMLVDAYSDAAALGSMSVRACICDTIVGDDAPLSDVAEIEFFPPLSGG